MKRHHIHTPKHLQQEFMHFAQEKYKYVFGEHARQYERLRADMLDASTANRLLSLVLDSVNKQTKKQSHKQLFRPILLDIGCGFGTFVLVAQKRRIQAIGIDTSTYELQYARRRSPASPTTPFLLADARHIPFADNTFDIITMWNLLEHVPAPDQVIQEAKRVLKPHGSLFLLCPNYTAIRKEAHYHLWLPPFLPKYIAAQYLRWRNRDAAFFLQQVHPVSNLRVIRMLHKQGFLLDFGKNQLQLRIRALAHSHPTLAKFMRLCFHTPFSSLFAVLYFYNPLKPSISIRAIKPMH